MKAQIPRSIAAVTALTVVSCASPPPPATTTALTGGPLVAAEIPAGRAKSMQLELEAARAAWEYEPSEMSAVWVGRRLAYLGRYDEAIAWYRGALETYPDSYRLRRHLGHRLLTTRQIDEAIVELTAARALAADQPNRLEPDGAPGPTGEPRSTTHGNIDYHLALGLYLRGDFDRAAELWLGCIDRWARNDDARVAALHWAHTSLVRSGQDAEARTALERVSDAPDVIENDAYAELVQLYRGDMPLQVALARSDRSAAFEYGLARHMIASERAAEGEALLTALAQRSAWPAFGVLAAEADVARAAAGATE
ncbi:MAG: tetratricopeptide repeat protein [Planctomycetota bacterium]